MCSYRRVRGCALRRNPCVYATLERRRSRAGFRIGTPTNPKGGWSFDLGVNGRSGTASNPEAELAYGLTQNIKLAISGPLVFQPERR